jgi:hypothetical protein
MNYADFVGESESDEFPMCSTSALIGYMHRVGAIFSGVHLERTFSLSTADAEFKTFMMAAKVIDSVRQFLEEVCVPQREPTLIYNGCLPKFGLDRFRMV